MLRPCPGAVLAVLVIAGGSCGAGSGVGPFGALPGASVDNTARALKAKGYCPPNDLVGDRVVFPRCPQPGLELYVSRVEADFDGGSLVRATRVEVHADEGQAMRRWHDVVNERAADGRERALGGDQLLRQHGILPDGAMSWVVWQLGGNVHAVILARPSTGSFEVVEVITAEKSDS